MKDLLDKMSSYNILNFLFPGIIYVIVISNFTSFQLVQTDIVITLFISYFCGLVISRIGSIIIEPILKKTNIIKYAKYSEFIIASKNDLKIETLSETNNTYRSYISCCCSVVFTFLYDRIQIFFKINTDISFLFVAISLTVLFILSNRKQSKYITDRVNIINKE